MSITSDVMDYCEKALKTAPEGLSSIDICEHFKGVYNRSQVRGGLETAFATGKLRKIAGHHETHIPGTSPVNFTLPGLALTAHIPSIKNSPLDFKKQGAPKIEPALESKPEPALESKPEPKPEPAPESKPVTLKRRNGVRDEVHARLPIDWAKNRRQFTQLITTRLELEERVSINVIYGQLGRGEIISLGKGRDEYLAAWLGQRKKHTFKGTDAEILLLVTSNPAMCAEAIQLRVGAAMKGGAIEGRNRLEAMVTAGRLFWSNDHQRYQLAAPEAPAVAPEVPAVAPEVPAVVAPVTIAQPIEAPAPALQGQTAGFLVALQTQIQSLAATIADSLAAQIADNLRRNLASLETAQPMPVFTPAAIPLPDSLKPEKKHALKVVVAGLLPQQAGAIVSEFPALDFAFIETDRIGEKIEAQIKHADVVFAMTKFLSHSLDGRLKHHPNFHRINGGLSSLRNLLRGELSKVTQ